MLHHAHDELSTSSCVHRSAQFPESLRVKRLEAMMCAPAFITIHQTHSYARVDLHQDSSACQHRSLLVLCRWEAKGDYDMAMSDYEAIMKEDPNNLFAMKRQV